MHTKFTTQLHPLDEPYVVKAQDALAERLWREHQMKVEIPASGESIAF